MPSNFPIRESNSTNFDQFRQAFESLTAEQFGDERIVDFALAWLRSHDRDLRFVDYRAVESLLGRIGTNHPSRAVELQSVLENFFSPEELAATARAYLDEDADAEDEEILRNCLQLMGKQDTHYFNDLFANSPLSGNSLRMALEQIALLPNKQRQIVGAFMANLSEGEWDEHLCVYLGMFPEKEIEPLLELAYPLVKRLPLGAMRVQALETLKAIHPPDRQGQMGEALSKTPLEELYKELGSFRMFPKNTFSTLCRYGPPPSEMLERIEVTPELQGVFAPTRAEVETVVRDLFGEVADLPQFQVHLDSFETEDVRVRAQSALSLGALLHAFSDDPEMVHALFESSVPGAVDEMRNLGLKLRFYQAMKALLTGEKLQHLREKNLSGSDVLMALMFEMADCGDLELKGALRKSARDRSYRQLLAGYLTRIAEQPERRTLFLRAFESSGSLTEMKRILGFLEAAVTCGAAGKVVKRKEVPVYEILKGIIQEELNLKDPTEEKLDHFLNVFPNFQRLLIYHQKIREDRDLEDLFLDFVAGVFENPDDFSFRKKSSQTLQAFDNKTREVWSRERSEPLVLEPSDAAKKPLGESFAESLGDGHWDAANHPALAAFLKGEEATHATPFEEMAIRLIGATDDAEKIELLKKMSLSKEVGAGLRRDLNSWVKLLEAAPRASAGRTLVVTGDPKLIFHCGSDVLASCQSVETWDYNTNKALMGYVADGKVMMAAVLDPQRKIEHRAILRLLIDRDKKPVVVMERSYGTGGGGAYDKALVRAAKAVADELKVPLVSDWGTGDEVGPVTSLGNPAPYEYVDSERLGVVTGGAYILTGLKKVLLA